MARPSFFSFFLVVLGFVPLAGTALGQQGTAVIIHKEHKAFYRVDSTIDVNAILEIEAHGIEKISSVTVHFHMALSSLGAQWLADEEVLKEIELSKGLGQSVTLTYDLPYPVRIGLRLKGDQGQIQVTSVEASVVKSTEGRDKEITVPRPEIRTRELKRATSFEIVSPAGGESWGVDKTVTLYWKSSGIGGKLALELFRNRDKVASISQNVQVGAGRFLWILSGKGIVPGGGYQVRMTTLADKKSYVSDTFSISEDFQPATLRKYTPALQTLEMKRAASTKPVSLKVLAPKYQDQWNVLQDYPIRWESEGLTREDDIAIALKPISGTMAKIICVTKNTGEYMFQVPYPLIFTGFDIQVILAPLKYRSVEALSEPFSILRPMVDLIANNPSISYTFPERHKRKWWEVVGDIFTGGVSWYVNQVVEGSLLKAEGTHMDVDVNVINKGFLTRKDVTVECSIQTDWGNVLYSFPARSIPVVYPDSPAPVSFSARTKGLNLEKGTYVLEVLIDPDNKTGELEPFRVNNRVTVEFEVK
jgi:hypothetical protein